MKYMLIGAVCGLALNYAIMYSPLPEMFPAYTEKISSGLFSVNIIYGILLYCIAAPILEELVFRILLYDTVYRFLGFLPAAVIHTDRATIEISAFAPAALTKQIMKVLSNAV